MSSEVANSLGATCPSGGSFYICYDKPNRFVGCCSVDPCKTDDGLCPDDDLRYTSFSVYSFNQLKAQECASSDPKVQWFTCAEINEPFMGCCTGNPCTDKQGCAQQNISAAILNSDADLAAPFMRESDKKEGLSTGAKAGIGVGVALGAAAIVAIFAYFYLRMRNKSKAAAAAAAAASSSPFDHQDTSDKPASQSKYGSKVDGSVVSPFTSVYAPSFNPNGTYDPNQQHQNNGLLNVQQWQYQQSQSQGSQHSPTMSQGGFAPSNMSSSISPVPQNLQPYGGAPLPSQPVELPNDFVTGRESAVEKPPAEIGDTGK